jgi:hypothetical protein
MSPYSDNPRKPFCHYISAKGFAVALLICLLVFLTILEQEQFDAYNTRDDNLHAQNNQKEETEYDPV